MERKALSFAAMALLIVGLATTGCEGDKKEETARLKKENEKLKKDVAQLQAKVDQFNDNVLMDKAEAGTRAELLAEDVQRYRTRLRLPEADRKALSRLHEMIMQAIFDQTELEYVFQWFRDGFEVGIDVDWSRLNAKGINKSTVVSVDLNAPTMGEALGRMLDDAGKKGNVELGFAIRLGRVFVSTKEQLKKLDLSEFPGPPTRPARRPPPKRIAGKVTSVRDDPASFHAGFAVIEVAAGEGLKPGMEFIIHRGQMIVAHLVVKEAAGNRAAGIIARETLRARKGDGAVLISQTPVTRNLVIGLADAYRARLKEEIRELNFDGTEFKNVIQFLRDMAGMGFDVKWSALNKCGIYKTTAVNLHLENASLEEAWKQILTQLSQGAKGRLVLCLPVPPRTSDPYHPMITTMEDLRRMGTLEDDCVRVVQLMDIGSEESNRSGHRALARPVGQAVNQELGGALDWLAKARGLKIDVDWTALTEAGLDKKVAVSVGFQRWLVPLETVLVGILSDAAGTTKLAYRLDNGKVVISTLKDLKGK